MLSVAHFASSDKEEHERSQELISLRRQLRHRSNIFDLPSSIFKSNFRLNKDAFRYVLRTISHKLQDECRSTRVTKTCRLAATMRILAEGSYQRGSGNDFNVCLAQPTISNAFHECVDAMLTGLCPKWVSFKMTEQEKTEIKEYFYRKTGFPGVIGCVDGTHVKILAPPLEERYKYCNRKGFYSLNAMVVCDHELKIRYISANHPGSAHDSLIWNTTDLRPYLSQMFANGERNTWLLGNEVVFQTNNYIIYTSKGDAGYPLQPYLITPFRAVEAGNAECRFNTIHSRTRNVVERTIGVLKNRFRCVLGARQLHYTPHMSAKITAVCAALHNICIHYKINSDEFDIQLENEIVDDITQESIGDMNATSIRQNIINSLNMSD